jgi:hypothetical protein
MPPAEAQRAIERFRLALLAGDQAARDALINAYGPIWQSIQADVISLLELAQERGLSLAQIQRLTRYQQLQSQISDQVERYSVFAEQRIVESQRLAVGISQQSTRVVVSAALPRGISLALLQDIGIGWSQLPVEAFESFIGISGDGAPLGRLLSTLGTDAQVGVRQGIAEGILRGRGPRQTSAIIRNNFGLPLTRSLSISRTETLRAYRESSRLQYANNRHIVKGYRRHSARDERVCPACIALDGTFYENNVALDSHVNDRCHPAGVLTNGPTPVAASKRFYKGKMIAINTAAGVELSFTPNHPILTSRGWIAGGFLQKGDYVVRSTGEEWTKPTIDVNYQNVPALIEDVFEAFSMVTAPVPTASEDFHGDGEGSQVHVIGADRLLRSGYNTPLNEPILQVDFGRANMTSTQLTSLGDFDAVFYGMNTPLVGVTGTLQSALLLSNRHTRIDQLIGGLLCSQNNTGIDESDPDGTTADIECFGQAIFRFAGYVHANYFVYRDGSIKVGASSNAHLGTSQTARLVQGSQLATFPQGSFEPDLASMELAGYIFEGCPRDIRLDRILKVTVSEFSGHVYNLQSPVGWYIANGIITHNCALIPETVSYKDLGIDIPDDPMPPTARDWFNEQGPVTQQRMLGKGRYDSWKAGEFQLEEMAKVVHDDVWGDSAVTKPLKELVGVRS